MAQPDKKSPKPLPKQETAAKQATLQDLTNLSAQLSAAYDQMPDYPGCYAVQHSLRSCMVRVRKIHASVSANLRTR